MKILVLNYEYPPLGGGGAFVTKELCEKTAANGHEMTIVTMGFRNLPEIEDVKGVTIHRVKCWRTRQRVCHPWEQLSYCINAYNYINKKLNINEFDFVHCHFIIPTGLLALMLNKKYGIKYIITSHGSDVIGHNNMRFSLLYKIIKPGWKLILKNASEITAPSNYLMNKILDTYPNLPIKLIPNGIHVCEYTSMNKRKSIVTMTRLQESKGVQDLVEACGKVRLNGWEVNILGDGPYRSVLEKKVKELKLQDVIHFCGHVEGDKKNKYLGEAGAFFAGSKFESFSISVLEATLCGCNVIASDIEPHKVLVGEKHIYSSASQLVKMLQDVFDSKPSVVAYNNDKYDWDNIYQLYLTEYKNVCK